MGAWAEHAKKRGRPRGESEWRPKQAGGLGRREDDANFTLLSSVPGGPAPFCLLRGCIRPLSWTPGRMCDCCFAAFHRAPPPPVPSSGPRTLSWGRFFRSGQFRSSSSARTPGNRVPGLVISRLSGSPPPRFPPTSTRMVAAERRLPMGALFYVTDHWANPRAVAGVGQQGPRNRN